MPCDDGVLLYFGHTPLQQVLPAWRMIIRTANNFCRDCWRKGSVSGRDLLVSPVERLLPCDKHPWELQCILNWFCYNLAAMYVEIHLGDIVRLRKKHPCGSFDWEVVRLGADVGLICQGCGRKVMLPRGTFNKRYKSTLSSVPHDE